MTVLNCIIIYRMKLSDIIIFNSIIGTADALGLSRAILCNDVLVKRLQDLERTGQVYRG